MSALFTQCLGDTVQTGTGKVDPARKFKCTTAVHIIGQKIWHCQHWIAGHLKLCLQSLKLISNLFILQCTLLHLLFKSNIYCTERIRIGNRFWIILTITCFFFFDKVLFKVRKRLEKFLENCLFQLLFYFSSRVNKVYLTWWNRI